MNVIYDLQIRKDFVTEHVSFVYDDDRCVDCQVELIHFYV